MDKEKLRGLASTFKDTAEKTASSILTENNLNKAGIIAKSHTKSLVSTTVRVSSRQVVYKIAKIITVVICVIALIPIFLGASIVVTLLVVAVLIGLIWFISIKIANAMARKVTAVSDRFIETAIDTASNKITEQMNSDIKDS